MNTKSKADYSDVYEDLQEFKQTRESVNKLLQFKRDLSGLESTDRDQIRARAMDAIDSLFSEEADDK